MTKAVYPGTFDPLSKGHLSLIERASKIFDEVDVLVSLNIHKHPVFTLEERIDMVKRCCAKFSNVTVHTSDKLVVQYAKENNIKVIIRGLRNFQDYESEFSLAQFNKEIDSSVETFLMMPSAKHQFVSSSSIKELVTFGVDISKYVPKEIVTDILNKFNIKK